MPLKIVADKLASYSAAKKEPIPSVEHTIAQCENNGCELSHQPIRQEEIQMRQFKLHGQVQWFLSYHGVINNLFRPSRHLMQAKHYRLFRDRSFAECRRGIFIQSL